MKKRIVIAGGSGFLGNALAQHCAQQDADIVVLTRRPATIVPSARTVWWDGRTIGEWSRELESAYALINLAGRSVNCRYHARNRREILESRVATTRILGESIARCATPPRVWFNASTATIYRHTFSPAWDESGEIGDTPEAKDAFSVEVACAWEQALWDAVTPRTHKVALRSAMGARASRPLRRSHGGPWVHFAQRPAQRGGSRAFIAVAGAGETPALPGRCTRPRAGGANVWGAPFRLCRKGEGCCGQHP
ncbi:MAG: NAD-dependent epimerase/dehydratase family protein [Planctomycetota bacterium]